MRSTLLAGSGDMGGDFNQAALAAERIAEEAGFAAGKPQKKADKAKKTDEKAEKVDAAMFGSAEAASRIEAYINTTQEDTVELLKQIRDNTGKAAKDIVRFDQADLDED